MIQLTLKMTTAHRLSKRQTRSTTVLFRTMSYYVHPDDHAQPPYEITPGLKPFRASHHKLTLKNCWTRKNVSKTTIAILFNQVHPSVPPFVYAALFIPSFNILRGYFSVSLNLLAVPSV